jgi:hypothetical protein
MIIENWLPENKIAAVCFTIDDLHPASFSRDGYDAGGDLGAGVFGLVDKLLKKHPKLKVTLFTTADWREKSPFPTRTLLKDIPFVRDYFYLASRTPKSHFRLDKYKTFVDYYNNHPQVEIAYHGLSHCHKGIKIPVEFQKQSLLETDKIIKKMLSIFETAELNTVPGFTPPAWNAPPNLIASLIHNGFKFIASARDIVTDISKTAVNGMSGYPNVSILYPEYIENDLLVHIPSNFQATSSFERAEHIIENNGILSIKAHIIKESYGHVALDGIDADYIAYLDEVLCKLENKYADSLWWTTMGEMAEQIINKNDGIYFKSP